MTEHEAAHAERRPGDRVTCRVCPHLCEIAPGGLGLCRVRQNLGGILYATSYEEIARLEVVAVERVPLFHYRPGARFLAIGSIGESFPPGLAPPSRPLGVPGESRFATTREAIDIAVSKRVAGIACAGGEPFMWIEQWRELAAAARAEAIESVAITNGFALPAAVAGVAPLLDAVNLVLLGPDEMYRRHAKTGRDPVLETARTLAGAGVHLELTFLVVAGENDNERAIEDVAALTRSLGSPPLHLASPVDLETAAPFRTMHEAAGALRARLPHVYISSIYARGDGSGDTTCRACKAPLVRRKPDAIEIAGLSPEGVCARCGAANGFRLS